MGTVALILIVAIIGLAACIGLIVVGFMWKPDGKANQPKPAAKADTPRPANPASAPAAAKPALDASPGPREVLRVLRDAATEELSVEVAGRRYGRLADIHETGVREGLLSTLRDLEAFARGAPTVPPVVVVPVPATQSAVIPPTLTNIGAAPAAPAAKTAGKAGAAAAATGTGPLLAPSMNPFKQMLVLRDLNKTQLPPLKTIAEQIDEIVQEKLADTPLVHRGVKVHTGPQGNALFRADGQDYEAVDSLPDDEIRGLIRAAVKEWEQQQ